MGNNLFFWRALRIFWNIGNFSTCVRLWEWKNYQCSKIYAALFRKSTFIIFSFLITYLSVKKLFQNWSTFRVLFFTNILILISCKVVFNVQSGLLHTKKKILLIFIIKIGIMLTVGNIGRNISNSLTSSRMYFDKHFCLKYQRMKLQSVMKSRLFEIRIYPDHFGNRKPRH